VSRFGRPRRHLRTTDSTNERARELAEAGAPSGTVVTASEQTAGRGRHGRAWTAPPASALLYSAILRPLTARHSLLPIAVPLAVCEAIEAAAPVRCEVKWPNDVWIERRKAAGVLIEARPPEWAVIGIGVNVAIEPDEFPPDLRWPATSVGHGAPVEAVLEELNGSLSAWVEAPPRETLEAFRRRDALSGKRVSWEGPGEGGGTARGVDDRGNLVVETEAGEVALGSGEVTLRVSVS
jgi:BirA family transcriptional regulator, biotin operon repressor / biotin---[acetyl-CoA-carboxylase] ligase